MPSRVYSTFFSAKISVFQVFTFVVKSQEMAAVKIKSCQLSFFRLCHYHLASFVELNDENSIRKMDHASGYNVLLRGIHELSQKLTEN